MAYVKEGAKKLGLGFAGVTKKWKAWFSKENDEMVLGSYSEEIVSEIDEECSTEEAVDEC